MSKSLMKGGINPYYDNYGAETMTKLDDYTGNISALLNSLEEKGIDPEEVHLIKLTTSSLLDMFEDNQNITQSELEGILRSIKNGTLSVKQIKNMKVDHEKSEYALRIGLQVQSLLDKQFESMAMLVQAVESGGVVNAEDINGMFKEMNVLMNSVNSLTKVMKTDGEKVGAVIEETEAALVSDIAKVTSLHESVVNHGVHHSKVHKYNPRDEKHEDGLPVEVAQQRAGHNRITPRQEAIEEEATGITHKNMSSKKSTTTTTATHKNFSQPKHYSTPGMSPSSHSGVQ